MIKHSIIDSHLSIYLVSLYGTSEYFESSPLITSCSSSLWISKV